MKEDKDKKIKYWLGGILVLGAFLRFWGMDWGLPFEYQSEEYRVIKYALQMGGGDLNPHFFEYPTLYLYFMLAVFGGYFIFGWVFGIFPNVESFALQYVRDPSCFHLLGRFFESFFGLGVIFLTYIIGKRIFSSKIGLLAALIVAILTEFVNKGHFAKGDMAAIFLGLCFFLLCVEILEKGDRKYYIAAGAVFGLAISTKYYIAILGIVLPLAHLLSDRRKQWGLLALSLAVIPLFFVIGTPYSVLDNAGFLSAFSDAQTWFERDSAPNVPSYGERVILAFRNLVTMYDGHTLFLIGSRGIGALSILGAGFIAWQRKKKGFLLALPLPIYWGVVSAIRNPAAGYMAPVFPLFAVCAAYLVVYLAENFFKARFIIWGIFAACALSAFGDSFTIAYLYTVKDNRTSAREWIYKNLPSGSRVLMDQLVNSPPLDLTYEELQRRHKLAVQLDHYKKEYLRLKLAVHPGPGTGYDVVLIKRSTGEIGAGSASKVKEIQSIQKLAEVYGDGRDVGRLKKLGIEYVVLSAFYLADASTSVDRLNRFYQEVLDKAELLKSYEFSSIYHMGPMVWIYKL